LQNLEATVCQEVDTSAGNAIASGEKSDDFALKCCIELRKSGLKIRGSYLPEEGCE